MSVDISTLVAPPSEHPLTPEPVTDRVHGYFRHTDEVPEGCQVIAEPDEDDIGLPVGISKVTYVTRLLDDGSRLDLPMWLFTPSMDNAPGKQEPEDGWPVIVFVRGSAFHEQNVLDYSNFYVRIASHGYIVAAMKYRQSDLAPFPAQAQDCKTAVRFIRKNAERFHANKDRVALWGDSSGGHTVLMAGFTAGIEPDTPDYADVNCEVKAIVDWYGPTDFTMMNYYPSSQNHSDSSSPEGCELGGIDVLTNPERNRQASPMTYLSEERSTPPTLIMHGGRDQLVPFNQSCRLFETMKMLNKDVTFIKLDNACHACYGFRSEKAIEMSLDWLQSRV